MNYYSRLESIIERLVFRVFDIFIIKFYPPAVGGKIAKISPLAKMVFIPL